MLFLVKTRNICHTFPITLYFQLYFYVKFDFFFNLYRWRYCKFKLTIRCIDLLRWSECVPRFWCRSHGTVCLCNYANCTIFVHYAFFVNYAHNSFVRTSGNELYDYYIILSFFHNNGGHILFFKMAAIYKPIYINISDSRWHAVELLVSRYMFSESRNTTVPFRKAKDDVRIGFTR